MNSTLIDTPVVTTSVPTAALVAAPAQSPAALMLAAIDKGADLDKLEKFMALQTQWEQREAEKAYNEAFAAFKADAIRIIKGAEVMAGPLAGRRYAALSDVVQALTPGLSRHGLSASWAITKDDRDWIEVTCTLKHINGHSESVSMGGPPDSGGAKNPLQARASTKTYLERYTLKAICGVAEADDDTDGNVEKKPPREIPPELLQKARDASMNGWDSLRKFIAAATEEERVLLTPESAALKAAAKAADKAAGRSAPRAADKQGEIK